MLILVYHSHCATHQIRVILISCVVITSLFYPALDVYTSSKYSSPATFLALTYFFPAVAQNAEVINQFPEPSPVALEVCIYRDPSLRSTLITLHSSLIICLRAGRPSQPLFIWRISVSLPMLLGLFDGWTLYILDSE